MVSIRPDLDAERAKASTVKVPLGMESAERRRLMDVLLRLHEIAMQAFDAMEADALSEADVLLLLQLPDYCNQFTRAIERHARTKADAIERQRTRTSYMGRGR